MSTILFNTAAAPTQPYEFSLNREVAGFYRDHPEQKRKIFFIDASTPVGRLERGNEQDADEIATLLAANTALQNLILTVYKSGHCYSDTYGDYGCVVLKSVKGAETIRLLGADVPDDINDAYAFAHEAGHVLCPGALEGTQLKKERIADAYAVLWYLKQFGADTVPLENLITMRALVLATGKDTDHFTAPLVERILADNRRTNLTALTPAERVVQAVRYGTDNTMDVMLTQYIADKLSPLRGAVRDMMRRDFSALYTFSQQLLRTNMPEEFKWGARAVKGLLDGNLTLDGTRLPKPQGPEWARLRDALDHCATTFKLTPFSL